MYAGSRQTLLVEGLAGLFRLPLDTPEPDLLTNAINLAEAATSSRIGYVHGASIGAVFSRDTLPGIESMLRRADEALYLAKSRGGGLVIAGHEQSASTG